MIEDINSVPARIVILGTSKMKLSERFNQLNSETNGNSNGSSTRVSKVKAEYYREPNVRLAPHLSSSSSYGNASVGGGTLVSDQRNGFANSNNSFLFDDYMSNDLFDSGGMAINRAYSGSNNRLEYRQPMIKKQQTIISNRPYKPLRRYSYAAADNDYYDDEDLFTTDPLDNEDLDPLSLPLDTYRDLTRARRRGRRPFQGLQAIYSLPARRAAPKRGAILANQIYEEYYQPRSSIHHRTTKRTPIHNRITIKRLARPANFSTLNYIKSNSYRGPPTNFNRRRGGGGRFKRGAGARFGAGYPRKTFNKKPQPKKKTQDELDKELEMYMNSGKHPRVAPVV